MTRFLAVSMMLLVWMGCERDYRAGVGYGPQGGGSNAGNSYAQGGGLIAADDATDGTAVTPDTKPGDTSGQTDTAGGDTTCTGTESYCTCMADFGARADFCGCQETQAQEHPEDNYYCHCNFLVCVETPFEGTEAFQEYCLGLYTALCDPFLP